MTRCRAFFYCIITLFLSAASLTSVANETANGLDFQQLHTYQELQSALHNIKNLSNGHVQTGPLIKNGDNGGLVDIDIAFNENKTIREAVLDTVRLDTTPSQGNSDPSVIGQSNLGRDLLAARFGHGPIKVVYITQQHGNEFIATEAAVDVLKRLSHNGLSTRYLAEKISLLVLVRANPDGGEPDPSRCQVGAPFPAPQNADYACAFYRFNIDPTAGTLPTEDPFRGAVGVGYNLNRYHHPNLDQPIRPVENQAMVAAILAFQPNYVLDFHGDIAKLTCTIDPSSITFPIPGVLFDSTCLEGEDTNYNHISIRDLAEVHRRNDPIAQRWIGLTARFLEFWGFKVGRHRQIFEATEFTNSTANYAEVSFRGKPVHSVLLEQLTLSSVVDPIVVGLDFSTSPPTPDVRLGLNGVLGQENFLQQKAISEFIMLNQLRLLASGAIDLMDSDGGYLKVPTDTAIPVQLSETSQQLLQFPTDETFLVPLCILDECLTGQ